MGWSLDLKKHISALGYLAWDREALFYRGLTWWDVCFTVWTNSCGTEGLLARGGRQEAARVVQLDFFPDTDRLA